LSASSSAEIDSLDESAVRDERHTPTAKPISETAGSSSSSQSASFDGYEVGSTETQFVGTKASMSGSLSASGVGDRGQVGATNEQNETIKPRGDTVDTRSLASSGDPSAEDDVVRTESLSTPPTLTPSPTRSRKTRTRAPPKETSPSPAGSHDASPSGNRSQPDLPSSSPTSSGSNQIPSELSEMSRQIAALSSTVSILVAALVTAVLLSVGALGFRLWRHRNRQSEYQPLSMFTD
jgi:hypothetical protein